jgi:multiple sugar transport system substrate-binding protein
MTWDDVYDLSKRLTRSDGGEMYQGITFVVNNMMLNNQLSVGPLHPKEDRANLNTDEWKKLFENFGRFFQIPNASNVPVGDFAKGKVAMIVNAHPSIVGYSKESPALNWDVVSVPVLKEKPNTGFKPASLSLFVTQTSKHKDDAFLTVAYLVSEEVQTLIAANGSATPLASKAVQQSTGKNIPEWKGKNVNALYYYQDAPPTPPRDANLTNVGVNYEKWFHEMIQKQIDVNTALRSFEEEVNQAIAAEKAKTGK